MASNPKAETSGTPVLSVRLPSVETRDALTNKCDKEGITVSAFVTTAVQAFIDGRLRIIEPPPPAKPSFFVRDASEENEKS